MQTLALYAPTSTAPVIHKLFTPALGNEGIQTINRQTRASCGLVGFWSQLNYESQVINRNRQRQAK